MTDDQIRAWLNFDDRHQNLKEWMRDCLTELLAHRQLHRSIKWVVWVADQSAESGWKMVGAFRCEGEAHNYRAQFGRDCALPEDTELLVLPFQEFPCLTAR